MTSLTGHQNGRLPDSILAPILGGRLRRDAAAAWNAMNVVTRRHGVELRPTGSKSAYRTFAEQQELYRTMAPGMAAVPGTSNHGWGLAVDVPTVAMQNAINAHGAVFGYQKKWSDAQHEPWHFTWRVGHWSGPDPGPTGQAAPAQAKREDDWMRLAIGYNADGRVQMARIRGTAANNTVEHQWMQNDGKWSGWRGLAFAAGRSRPVVSLQYSRHPDGRLELFAMTDHDTPWRIHQLGPNGNWAERFVQA